MVANGANPMTNATLADQLRNRLEERRKSKDEEQQNFVPDAIAADIQKAVKMANDNSKFYFLQLTCRKLMQKGVG